MRKCLIFFIALYLCAPLNYLFADAPIILRILHFNDVYEVAPQKDAAGQSYAGFAELKTLMDQKKNDSEYNLVTFGGDPRLKKAFIDQFIP